MGSYRERLRVPVWWWIIAAAAVVTVFAIVAVPAGPVAGAVSAAISAALLLAYLLGYGGAVVELDDRRLRAGRAGIDRRYLGRAEALTGEDARNAFGRNCDPRAYLLLRSYTKGAVRVELTDPADPAPYWLIATRHPERLATALNGPRIGYSMGRSPTTD